jgi:CBS domain-containing protein
MREHRIGCIVVSRDGKRVDGIVAARDIAYAIAERQDRIRSASGADILDLPISRIMKQEVQICSPRDTLRHVIMEMARLHILHVPVVDNEDLCGIISIDDVVKLAIGEMDLEKQVLQDALLVARTMENLR